MTRHVSLAALLALGLAACADNRSSIEILGRAAPQDVTTCKFSATGDHLLGPGVLDVSYGVLSYGLVVYLKNNLEDPQKLSPSTVTDSKSWRATSVRVRLNPSDYASGYGAVTGLLAVSGEQILPLDNNVLVPAGGTAAQYVDALAPAPLGQAIAAAAPVGGTIQRVVLGITLRGQTLDGAKLDTGEWYFPVDVCSGCLVSPTLGNPPACPAGKTLITGNCFFLGQDSTPSCK